MIWSVRTLELDVQGFEMKVWRMITYRLHLHKQTYDGKMRNLRWGISEKRTFPFPDLVKVRGEVHVIAESLLLNVEVLLLR